MNGVLVNNNNRYSIKYIKHLSQIVHWENNKSKDNRIMTPCSTDLPEGINQHLCTLPLPSIRPYVSQDCSLTNTLEESQLSGATVTKWAVLCSQGEEGTINNGRSLNS